MENEYMRIQCKEVKQMKKLLAGTGAGMFVFFAFFSGVSFAGDYHRGTGLLCGDCHVMHASQQHAHDASYGGPTAGFPLSYTPADRLIRATSVNALCTSTGCHNGGTGLGDTAPDVLGAATYTTTKILRAAGGFYASDGAADLDYATPTTSTTSHDLGVAAATPIPVSGGLTLASAFTCASCHDPHGNDNYRNLQSTPDGKGSAVSITYANVTDVAGSNVFLAISSGTSGGKDTKCVYTSYTDTMHTDELGTCTEPGNARYKNEKISWFCRNCHQKAHVADPSAPAWPDPELGGGATGDTAAGTDQWKKHPVSDVTLGEANTNTHVDMTTWNQNADNTNSHLVVASAGMSVPNNDNIPICITCHQAHGSTHPFNLVYDDQESDALEDGANMIKSCDSCHDKQGQYTP